MAFMRNWEFAKGHGTMNDFVLLKDRTNSTELSPQDVRYLCDRRAGIGGDGVIRAVWAKYMPSWTGDPNMWFMDYRNSDGSVAEMCGNGLRVFGHFLLDENLADGPDIQVATRAGQRDVAEMNDELFRAGIGHVQVASQPTNVSLDGVEYEATTVDVGNPHAVVFLPADVDLESLDLSHPPRFDTRVYPAGTNIEFVRVHSDRSLSMRVFERGSGETMSCGTGVVATAAAQGARLGEQGRFGVDVPGGHLEVELDDSMAHLTGPAVIVAHGSVVLPDEAAR